MKLKAVFPIKIKIKKYISQVLLQTTSPKPLGGIFPNFTEMFFHKILFHSEFWLLWQPQGKTLKNLLVKNYQSNLNDLAQWYWGDPLH